MSEAPIARPDLRVSVVIMAFDEEASLPAQIARTVAYAARTFGAWEVLVVDDGSRDGTAACVERAAQDERRVRLLRHAENRGMGAAIRTGYGAAALDWITQLPADGQVRAPVLDLLLPLVPDTPLVIGRYERRADGPLRGALTWGFRQVARGLVGHPCDFTGTHVVRRDLLAQTSMDSDTFFANLEMPLGLIRRGVAHRFVTIPAPAPREHGTSRVAGARRIARVVGEMWRYRRAHGRAS